MPADTLDFEEPIAVLMKEIEALSMLPQTPERQEYGKATPARCAASSTVSPSATENWRSEDFRVTVCTRRIVVAIAADNNAGSHHGNQR